jgi:dienelactone hydrolase
VPGVDPRRIAVLGDSRGGEAALLLAATFPHLIHGAIGLVPNSSVYPSPAANLPAWTLHGRPVPVGPIPVERIDGPVLTAGAGDDHVWASAAFVRAIQHRLTARHFRFAHAGLVYPRAGHLIGTAVPYLPTSTDQPAYGGTARADAAARADLWRHILRFLAGRSRAEDFGAATGAAPTGLSDGSSRVAAAVRRRAEGRRPGSWWCARGKPRLPLRRRTSPAQ